MVDYKKVLRKAVGNSVDALDGISYLLDNLPSNCSEEDVDPLIKAGEKIGAALVLLGKTSINEEN